MRVRSCSRSGQSSVRPDGEIFNKEMNPPSLLIVSIHSSYGSESKTIPPWPIVSTRKSKSRSTYPCLEICDTAFDKHRP